MDLENKLLALARSNRTLATRNKPEEPSLSPRHSLTDDDKESRDGHARKEGVPAHGRARAVVETRVETTKPE